MELELPGLDRREALRYLRGAPGEVPEELNASLDRMKEQLN